MFSVRNITHRFQRLAIAAAAGLIPVFLCAGICFSADGMRYAPVIPEPNIPVQTLPMRDTLMTAPESSSRSDDEVVIPELRGIIIVDHPERLYAVTPEKSGISVETPNPMLLPKWSGAMNRLEKYLDRPLTVRQLKQMMEEIRQAYKQHNLALVEVDAPRQDAVSGTLQLLVIEGRVGSVNVSGARFFSNERLSRRLFTHSGDFVDSNDVREDLIWLNSNPFRQAEVRIEKGEEFGTADVYYDINDLFPLRATFGYNDTGTAATGLERVYFGATYGNLFGRSNLLNYQITASPDFVALENHSFLWMIPFDSRNYLTLGANYATLAPDPSQEGMHWSFSAMFNRRLWLRANDKFRRDARLVCGFEFVHTNTNLDYGGTDVLPFPVETAKFVIGFHWNHVARNGHIEFQANLNLSPGGFSKYNNSDYFHHFSGNEDTRSDYLYATFVLAMLRKCEFADLYCRVFGQVSSAALISYDQMGLGGTQSVRGYDQYTENSDGGFTLNLELRTPSRKIELGDLWQCIPPWRNLDSRFKYEEEWHAYIFYDLGVGVDWAKDGEDHQTYSLSGAGVGLRYNFGPWINLDLAYGFQLISDKDDKHSSRPHISVSFCR